MSNLSEKEHAGIKVLIEHDGTDEPHPWELLVGSHYVANYDEYETAAAAGQEILAQGWFTTASGRKVSVRTAAIECLEAA